MYLGDQSIYLLWRLEVAREQDDPAEGGLIQYGEVLVSENRTCDVGHYRAVPHQLGSHVKQTIFFIALSLPEESSCCAT
mgnify:CR=1 FL=1